MDFYPTAALERAMKVQEVILRAMAKRITWWQAAEIIGISDRQMRRWHQRYEEFGYDGLYDRRLGRPSPKRVPLKEVEEVLRLYREKYFDLNVRHFHEKLRQEHRIGLSYTWVKKALQGAGLVPQGRKRGVHRRRRERRPLPGMLLHMDGSCHRWFQDDRWYDLLVILDDATSEIYYAQLVEAEATATVMAGLREVVEQQGLFCALYSDRASHFFLTPRAGGKVDLDKLTAVGRALRALGIRMIPAYSPQARGRSERNFGTWQGRLPQELRLRGITTLVGANQFLREEYIAEFNRRFQVPAAQASSAFLPCRRKDLDYVFSIQHRRVVGRDNTVQLGDRCLQIQATPWRGTLANCEVIVYEHLDQTLSVRYGPHLVGRYHAQGWPLLADQPARKKRGEKAVEKTLRGKALPTFPPRLEIPQRTRDSHFPTATATTVSSHPQSGHITCYKKRTF